MEEQISRIKNFSNSEKHLLYAVWESKIRLEQDENLDLYYFLDDVFKEKYDQHRLKAGFHQAQILARVNLLELIYD